MPVRGLDRDTWSALPPTLGTPSSPSRETLSTLPGTVVRVPNHGMPLHVPGSSSTESGHAFTMTGESCGEENAAATATCESRRAEKHDLLTSEGKLGDLMVEVLVAPPFGEKVTMDL